MSPSSTLVITSKTIVVDTPDHLATARLIALKGAVRLETLGMKHSSGKKMWKVARCDLGLSGNSTIDDVYGALCKEVDRRLRRSEQGGDNASP